MATFSVPAFCQLNSLHFRAIFFAVRQMACFTLLHNFLSIIKDLPAKLPDDLFKHFRCHRHLVTGGHPHYFTSGKQ
jgi:hypothetical protein